MEAKEYRNQKLDTGAQREGSTHGRRRPKIRPKGGRIYILTLAGNRNVSRSFSTSPPRRTTAVYPPRPFLRPRAPTCTNRPPCAFPIYLPPHLSHFQKIPARALVRSQRPLLSPPWIYRSLPKFTSISPIFRPACSKAQQGLSLFHIYIQLFQYVQYRLSLYI